MNRAGSFWKIVFYAAAVMAILAQTGCSGFDSCSQDFLPPAEITTNSNPYHYRSLSSDLGISAARWVNNTTGDSGAVTVTQQYECVPFIGCGTWSVIEMFIPLTPGVNSIYVYHTSDGCEWRDDYLITLL